MIICPKCGKDLNEGKCNCETKEIDPRLEVLKNMAEDKGVTASALAVAWMVNLHRCEGFPRVIPLFGSGNVQHFVSNLKGTEIPLTDEELEILNKA